MKQFNFKFIILFLFLLMYRDIEAQNSSGCATPDPTEAELQAMPWYGNPTYLQNYIDSIKNAYSGNGTTVYQVEDRVRHRIPIHFWIFRGRNLDPNNILNDGETRDLPQEEQLQFMIDDANQAFTNADWVSWTRVYIACVDFIDVDDPELSDNQVRSQVTNNFDSRSLNVYIRAEGRRYFTILPDNRGRPRPYIVLDRNTYGSATSAKTFTHELGHHLGLQHTFLNHQLPCLREPVSRGSVGDGTCPPWGLGPARCSITGDLLCDTEADPKMEANQIGNCTYNDDEEDYRGDRYTPDPTNYMSYGEGECHTRFTSLQVGVMLFTLNTVYDHFFSTPTSINRFDTFEPNNTISGAENATSVVDRVVGSDADQIHSFHFNRCEGDWDRVDWLPVELPNRGHTDDFTIRIEELDANTIGNVELFTAGLSPVNLSVPTAPPAGFTVNLVPAATNVWTITIPCDLLQRNSPRLYIRVTKANNNNFGTYRVTSSVLSEPELSFVSNDQKCANEDFEVQVTGILPSMSVSWTAIVDTNNSTATPASVTSLANGRAIINSSIEGRVFITATIRNSAGCEEQLSLNTWIGKIPSSYLEIETPVNIDMQDLCPTLPLWLYGNVVDPFDLLDWENVLEIEWLSSNPSFQLIPTPSTGGRRVTVIPPATSYAFTNVTLRVRNECGWTESYSQLRNGEVSSSTCLGGIGRTMEVFPNPTKSDIKVVFKVECESCTAEEKENLYPKIDESTLVILKDAFGNIRLQYTGKQIPLDINKNIHLNLSKLPFGNYILQVITKEDIFFTHVIKE